MLLELALVELQLQQSPPQMPEAVVMITCLNGYAGPWLANAGWHMHLYAFLWRSATYLMPQMHELDNKFACVQASAVDKTPAI